MNIFLSPNNLSSNLNSTSNDIYTDNSDTFENIDDNIHLSSINNINKPIIKQDKLIKIRLKDESNNRYKLLPKLKK